ncbi:MAG: hypothetical protein ACRD3C_09385 [Vicinamibacterales bacterium]
MSSAAEARFRMPSPASVARLVKVIALDPACDDVLARLAEGSWNGVTFFPASAVADRTGRLVEDVATGDLVVMVAAVGGDASAAAVIGKACSDRRVHTATFVVRAASASDEALSKTLAQVRPWSLMVVIAGDDTYVEDILRSFR